ncbi:MAG: hypothetical protein K0A94_12280, partial [Desulfuromonadales bacterium]|nr:hypothetical protein [Desulfuromonadales bacterium]
MRPVFLMCHDHRGHHDHRARTSGTARRAPTIDGSNRRGAIHCALFFRCVTTIGRDESRPYGVDNHDDLLK